MHITLLSGGMDSAVMLYQIQQAEAGQVALSIDYGQRHIRELDSARMLCMELGVKHRTVRVDGITGGCLLDRSKATTGDETVVPGRNAIMLSLAANVAVQEGADRIAIGCNAADHETYIDCRIDYLESIAGSFRMLHGVRIDFPLIAMSKKQIRQRGEELRVPFQVTWSCYLGGQQPCGQCGACIERQSSL